MKGIETAKRPCRELIDHKWIEVRDDFEKMWKQRDKDVLRDGDGNEYESFLDWLESYSLAIDKEYEDEQTGKKGTRIEFSYGGPQDYVIAWEDGRITYHYLQWFDGAKKYLSGYDYDLMRTIFGYIAMLLA